MCHFLNTAGWFTLPTATQLLWTRCTASICTTPASPSWPSSNRRLPAGRPAGGAVRLGQSGLLQALPTRLLSCVMGVSWSLSSVARLHPLSGPWVRPAACVCLHAHRSCKCAERAAGLLPSWLWSLFFKYFMCVCALQTTRTRPGLTPSTAQVTSTRASWRLPTSSGTMA